MADKPEKKGFLPKLSPRDRIITAILGSLLLGGVITFIGSRIQAIPFAAPAGTTEPVRPNTPGSPATVIPETSPQTTIPTPQGLREFHIQPGIALDEQLTQAGIFFLGNQAWQFNRNLPCGSGPNVFRTLRSLQATGKFSAAQQFHRIPARPGSPVPNEPNVGFSNMYGISWFGGDSLCPVDPVTLINQAPSLNPADLMALWAERGAVV